MKLPFGLLIALVVSPLSAQTMDSHSMTHDTAQPTSVAAPERLGTVNFAITCSAASQAPFNRGVALLHDFWYEEAERQFSEIEKQDRHCAMAHWGVAMSGFHQIWRRPGEADMQQAWSELKKAQSPPANSARERAYITALSDFFRPGKQKYEQRIAAYSAAMGKLYAQYPDTDSGAFYALALMAASADDDTSLAANRAAMAVLTPLFAKDPDNPGVDHYIIHACDNPAMAADGLAASDHYLEIAQSGAHAYHMPGHIYSRLGLWPQDITSQLGSIEAATAAQAKYGSGMMDEPHSFDFVLYAYIQSGQDARVQWALTQSALLLNKIAAMPRMANQHMGSMVPYYRSKYAVFYTLEMRDWKDAAALEPVAGAPPEVATLAVWARTIAHGHLHQAKEAQADLARYDALTAEVKGGKNAYMAEGVGEKIDHSVMLGWAAFAANQPEDALRNMRAAADLQDKVGQGEVDIPAREMLGDMLLELHRPQEALAEYTVSLKLSPNRFNGLYNAGQAAEAAGDKQKAQLYYAALLKSTSNGTQSERPELAHVKSFVSSTQLAAR